MPPQNQDDLFFAQGFVQAQDRLFQMDLWRRSVQGRLSEVLGANFIERDSMTRRVQFRGDIEGEWASYASDTRAVAEAFTRGINAWVGRARERLPEEFVLAGWVPELWRPEDLLNRTDAFVASGNALDEVLRARLIAALGADRAGTLFPAEGAIPASVPRGLDLAAINGVVSDALRRVGTPPFFMGFAASVGSNAWAVARGDRGAPLLATDPHRRLENPPPRYLVHLDAPGWQVAGATSPWLPGVVIGHNDRVAWGMTASNIDTQDIYVEKVNPANPHQVLEGGRWVDLVAVKEGIAVKGRAEPVPLEFEYTTHGPVIAIDRDRQLAYLLRWSGAEPGAAPELAALAIDRARSSSEFRDALARWKMPPGGVRLRRRQRGHRPPGRGPDADPRSLGGRHAGAGRDRSVRVARMGRARSLARASRIRRQASSRRPTGTRRGSAGSATCWRIRRRAGSKGFNVFNRTCSAWNAERLVPLLKGVVPDRADLDDARQRLLRWDRRITADSQDGDGVRGLGRRARTPARGAAASRRPG